MLEGLWLSFVLRTRGKRCPDVYLRIFPNRIQYAARVATRYDIYQPQLDTNAFKP